MTRRNRGWYYTWFHDPSSLKEDRDHPLGFSAKVYETLFIHRSRRELYRIIDFLVENVEDDIQKRRNTKSDMCKLTERYKKGLSKEECVKYDQTLRKGISEVDEEVENLKAWKEHWAFFRPSEEHWKYKGKNGIHRLILTRHFNPLEIHIENTMEHVDHKVKAEVLPDLQFIVSAGTYAFFVEQIRKKYREGNPYSILPQNPSFNIFVPSVAMIALENYPWDTHKEQMNEWVRARQGDRSKLAKHPNLRLD